MDFETRRMDLWEKIVPAFKYDKEVPFFEMLVPTVDTVRFGYLLEKFLSVNHSVLYTGGTGVGKVRLREREICASKMFTCLQIMFLT